MSEKRKSKKGLVIVIIILCLIVIVGAMLLLQTKTDSGKWPQVKEPAVNPLTGEVAGELMARPVVASTDNSPPARPQSGLSKADVVYEFPVEGGMSRLEPIYYSELPEEIGPSRSARPYFIDMAREYNAVFVHHGWSPEAKEYLESGVIPYISAFSESQIFYRSSERPAPHNSYTTGKEVAKLIEQKGWNEKQDVHGFQFLGKDETAQGDAVTQIDINYVGAQNHYQYDPETGLYTKTVGGQRYIDKTTGEDITTSNILVQKVTSRVLDAKGRLAIDMTAGGEALLFTGGVMIKGSWSRGDLNSPTTFTDEQGNEMKLHTGVTWVQVIDGTVEFSYQ